MMLLGGAAETRFGVNEGARPVAVQTQTQRCGPATYIPCNRLVTWD